jgi:peptidoglycan/xylan/chitin deacetylase (PgdA/CDA1 family)
MRRTAQRLRNMFAPGAVILLYHRVIETDCDPWGLAVTPKHFAEHLDVLQKYGRPEPLGRLSQAVGAGKRSPRTVSVTFDDGYADNLYNAKSLLERYDVAATVFVASGYVGNEREFWWDELERLLLQPGTVPQTVFLRVIGGVFERYLGESAHYSTDEYRRHRGWRCGSSAPTLRHSLYYSLWKLLGSLGEVERRDVLDQLIAWAGGDAMSRMTHRTLSAAELATLQSGGLIEIGSHTVTHPFLSRLSEARQRDEIRRSKADLEAMLDSPVARFAYPHGDYTMASVAIVQEAGFDCACSTTMESVRPGTDNLQLPRIAVEDWDGEEFARRLSRWAFDRAPNLKTNP